MTEVTGVDPTVLRDRLFDLWALKQPDALRVLAQQGFSELAEPLEGLLSLLEGCPGKQKGKTSTLGHIVLLEFLQWRKAHPQVTLQALPEKQVLALQRRALGLLTDAQPTFMDPLLDIYQLGSLDMSVLRLHIVRLQTLNCYREASLMTVKLSLQEELDMEEMCVPLILQDKLSMAETYVKGHPHLEERLVKLLDSWCHPSFTMEDISKQFPRLTLSKHYANQIKPKMLIKHVFRLVERFNLDPGLCPNAMYKRRLDSLRFLMYKRFVENGMSQENWSDHVQSTVANCPELQIQLVELLVKHCGLRSASQWSLRYNVPRDRLPFGVWDTQQSVPPAQRQVCANSCETWDPPPSHQNKFYQLPITRDRVHFVDMPEGLQQCKQAVLQPSSVVGLDMEWRAGFGSVSAQRVALIQLAVEGRVFLLDLCASGFCQHPDTKCFLRTLFSDSKVLKLGYGMAGDLKCLLTTWPEFSQEPLKFEGMMDLLSVHQQIQRRGCRRGPREVLVGDGPAEKGLSLLVQQVLGRPLDKMEQLSNWERRPLRINQMRYAAVDAYCLLDVYATLSNDPASFGLPADLRSIKPVQSERSKEDKKQKEKSKQARRRQEQQKAEGTGCSPAPDRGTLTGEVACLVPPMVPHQLRVVCDNMLQGLGRYLRCLGVDVVLLENTDDHRVAAQLAQAEGRVILTCGQPYQTLKSQVGEGRCLSLDCSEKARDQAVRVLKHFNVQPTPADIFSRCQVCNSDQYMRLTRADVSRMLRERGLLQDLKVNHQQTDSLVEEEHPDTPRYAPQCRWAPPSALDPVTLTFPGGAALQLHTVPPGLLARVPLFFVCTGCGKVFWEGSHFGRVMEQFQEVLKITEEDTPGTAWVAQKN